MDTTKKADEMADRCEAAVQERTGWGFFHRCSHRAKTSGLTHLGEPIRVCGLHARFSGSLIRSR